MDLLKHIKQHNLVKGFLNGNFGLEKEGLRTSYPANLADTRHPESLGDREVNPHIKTDYGEAQTEIITPPLAPYTNAHNWLQTLSSVLITSLPEDEYMWPFSVPNNLPEEELIRISETTNPDLADYRLYTASKYGKKRQLVTGIHINYSFDQTFLTALFDVQKDFETVEAMRDELYLKLASNFLRYQWLLVYLFGATPVAEAEFFEGPFFADKELPEEPMRSLRNSKFGFTNDPKVVVRYDSIANYSNDLQKHVATGLLRKEREYYGAVRLRGVIKDTSSLLENGIQYLEVRSFDNNPFQVAGLSKSALQLVHLFFLTMMALPEKVSADEVEKGNRLTKEVANEHPFAKTAMYDEGIWLCEQMKDVLEHLELSNGYRDLVNRSIAQLEYPEKTIAGRIISHLGEGLDLLELGEALGTRHKADILTAESLPGFEHLDPAHQQHLVSILQLGLDVPVEYIQEVHLEA